MSSFFSMLILFAFALEAVFKPCFVDFGSHFGFFSRACEGAISAPEHIAPSQAREKKLKKASKSTEIWFKYSFLANLLNGLVQESCLATEVGRKSFAFKVERASLNSDLGQIVEVINLAYKRQPFNRVDRERITLSQLKEILLNPGYQLFLLCCENKACGTVLLNQFEISLFAIHPDFQGHGYGRQLLSTIEEEAFKKYDSVQLKIIPLFQEKLIAYYENRGYCSYNEREVLSIEKLDRIQEKYHDQVYALIMRKNRP